MNKTQFTIDIDSKYKFIYTHLIYPNNIKDCMYESFESGYPIILDNYKIENFNYDYFYNLSFWFTEKNEWVKPWYPSDIKKGAPMRDASVDNDIFLKEHKSAFIAWNEFYKSCFPDYKTKNKILSHRYNQLIVNKLHLDLLDDDHTGNDQQMRMFLNLDTTKPRILAFSYTIEQLFVIFYNEKNLYQLDKSNVNKFISELRNRCIWNDEKNDFFTLPRHYITLNPGAIWIFNSQWISHQIIFGNKIQCFEVDIDSSTLKQPSKSISNIIKNL